MPPSDPVDRLFIDPTRPSFSFEFFPPADSAAQLRLTQTIVDLEPLAPDWVSVTYGANGSSRQRTLAATMAILASYNPATFVLKAVSFL